MTVAEIILEFVNDLLEWFDTACKFGIGIDIGSRCKVNNFLDCGGNDCHFFLRFLGEVNTLIVHFFCGIGNACGMVADTFKVADAVKDLGNFAAVAFCYASSGR